MRRILLGVAFILACALTAQAQESEYSGGGGTAGAITAGVGSGNAGRVPQFASTTSLVDSKMLTSGTNSGTLTLYDPTLVTGDTTLVIRQGVVDVNGVGDAFLLQFQSNAGGNYGGVYNGIGGIDIRADSFRDVANSLYQLDTTNGLAFGPSLKINWGAVVQYTGWDIGLARSAAGILAVTDGSTGYGMLRSLRLGVGAAPVTGTGLNITATTGMAQHIHLVGVGGILNPAIRFEDAVGTVNVLAVNDDAYDFQGTGGQYLLLKAGTGPYISLGARSSAEARLYSDSIGTFTIKDHTGAAGGIGISDSAEAAVSDALILRHNLSSDTATVGMGTGLLFQGEDAGGNMQSMASIDAVYTDATDGSEDSTIHIRTQVAGVDTLGLVLSPDKIAGANYLVLEGAQVRLNTSGADRWVLVDGAFAPLATNAYNFGDPTLLVKDSYLGTSIQGTRTKTIVDETATGFVTISCADNSNVAGFVEYTIFASDGTEHQSRTGQVYFSAVAEGTTVTAGTPGIVGTEVIAATTGTLTSAFTATTGSNVFTVLADANTSLGSTTTFQIQYRVVITSGTATVTPIP